MCASIVFSLLAITLIVDVLSLAQHLNSLVPIALHNIIFHIPTMTTCTCVSVVITTGGTNNYAL